MASVRKYNQVRFVKMWGPILLNIANPIDPLGLFPNSISLHVSTVGDTVRAWIPFGCLAKVLCLLDDAAIIAAIKFPDPSRGINSMPA
jgi:hypothetical protein